MNNHKTYCSLEICKLLKQAGFDWEVDFFYQDGILKSVLPDVLFDGNFEDIEYYYKHIGVPHHSLDYNGGSSKFIEEYSAPTLAVAQKWLREVKNMPVNVISYSATKTGNTIGYCYQVYERTTGWVFNHFSYEEALEVGIKKCLTLILEKDGTMDNNA